MDDVWCHPYAEQNVEEGPTLSPPPPDSDKMKKEGKRKKNDNSQSGIDKRAEQIRIRMQAPLDEIRMLLGLGIDLERHLQEIIVLLLLLALATTIQPLAQRRLRQHLLDHPDARVRHLVDPVAVTRQPLLLAGDGPDQRRHVLRLADLPDRLVRHVDGAAVQRAVRGRDGAGGRGERVGERGGGEQEGGGRGREGVVGVEDPEFGQGGDVLGPGPLRRRVDVVHHRQDVRDEGRGGGGGGRGGGRSGGVGEGDGVGVAVGHRHDGPQRRYRSRDLGVYEPQVVAVDVAAHV